MIKLSEIVESLNLLAPPTLASSGDNVGLQVGDLNNNVRRVVVGLDITQALIRLTRTSRAQLALVHHPLIFDPIYSLAADSRVTDLLQQAIRNRLAIFVMHTNLDYAPGGVNDRLAQTLGLRNVKPLLDWGKGSFLKLVVFVPQGDLSKVRRALCAAGAGRIGAYEECSFNTSGEGTFKPLKSAKPTIGLPGRLEKIDEERLELLVEKSLLSRVLQALYASHPYEEVAYDLYPLENSMPGAGRGRIGDLPKSVPLRTLVTRARKALKAEQIRISGDITQTVKRVAVASGSARGFVEIARHRGADALVVGEMPHHESLEAIDYGPPALELGHKDSERPAIWVMADWLEKTFADKLEIIRYDPTESTP